MLPRLVRVFGGQGESGQLHGDLHILSIDFRNAGSSAVLDKGEPSALSADAGEWGAQTRISSDISSSAKLPASIRTGAGNTCVLQPENMHWHLLQWTRAVDAANNPTFNVATGAPTPSVFSNSSRSVSWGTSDIARSGEIGNGSRHSTFPTPELRPSARAGHCCAMMQERGRMASYSQCSWDGAARLSSRLDRQSDPAGNTSAQ